jgi:hypothetical protein
VKLLNQFSPLYYNLIRFGHVSSLGPRKNHLDFPLARKPMLFVVQIVPYF